jgi:hypothetical protein
MKTRLSLEQIEKIKELYLNKTPVLKIAEIMQKPYPTITYILKRDCGYNNKRPSQGNVDYFSKIDTYSKAYILGYIAADGCIGFDKIKKLYNLTIVVNTKDVDFLNFIKSEIGFETKILNSTPYDKRTKKTYNRSSITLGNQTLCRNLIALGINRNKTFTLENFLPIIPKQFRKAVILGYFDGDGHVYAHKDKRVKNEFYRTYGINICGTYLFLKGIAEELKLEKFKITNKSNYYILDICNKKDFYNFYSCYDNLTFFLKRKHNVFFQRINYEQTISST